MSWWEIIAYLHVWEVALTVCGLITLPPMPLPLLLTLLLLDASRKIKYMEVVPRAVFCTGASWCMLGLSPPFSSLPSSTHSLYTTDRSCYLHQLLLLGPSAGECSLGSARYLQLPALAPPLSDKRSSVSTLGKA